jgi:hypothetical protein
MARFSYQKKVWVDFDIDDRALNHDDKSVTGESIAYILGGYDEWCELVNKLYDPDLDAVTGEYIINKLTNALEDTLEFQKIFTK